MSKTVINFKTYRYIRNMRKEEEICVIFKYLIFRGLVFEIQ
jgi:hypothetical protein